ncbi:MAG: bifunctional hydroxymethylpyrimidine kinase/phosphomethylpyrimidine kinase [Verrucomicrobiota bacterium]
MTTRYPSVLTIAGSDSGGCAGIQADIKSISACGGYAASVITATTAQNTLGVTDIHPIPLSHLEKQLDAVLSDIEFGAVKIGMLHSCDVIELVAAKLSEYRARNIVLDPVMVATSGDRLIAESAVNCLKKFLPASLLITPNLKEAEILMGRSIHSESLQESTKEIGKHYQTSVLLKGGHLEGLDDQMVDTLYEAETGQITTITNPRVETKNTHGTGCSLSSSIATYLSLGFGLKDSVRKGCQYTNQAILNGKDRVLGKGNGPINHFGL